MTIHDSQLAEWEEQTQAVNPKPWMPINDVIPRLIAEVRSLRSKLAADRQRTKRAFEEATALTKQCAGLREQIDAERRIAQRALDQTVTLATQRDDLRSDLAADRAAVRALVEAMRKHYRADPGRVVPGDAELVPLLERMRGW